MSELAVFALVVTAYFAAVNTIYLVQLVIGWRAVRSRLRSIALEDFHDIRDSGLAPPVSIVVPAYNEGVTIIESVRSLLSVVKNFGRPSYFVAFFPHKIEKKLLDLEMDYANRKYGIKDENMIHETKFDVIRAGGGYDVRVREVVLKR